MSEEAGIDQQTMKICIDEITRCQKTTPRPNFIVLLGDRYGWCPLPAEIPVRKFEAIRLELQTDDNEKKQRLALLDQWYKQETRPRLRWINKLQISSFCLNTFVGHRDLVNSCDVSFDNKRIVSASSDKEIKVWDANGKELLTLRGHTESVETCSFSPDGNKLVSGSEDHFFKIWDTETGKIICEYWTGASVQVVNWHPADKKLAAGDSSGRLHFLELDGDL